MKNKLLQIENVTKIFGNRIILNKLSLEISQGSIVAIMGESGSGKTTISRILCGFESIDSGTILLNNKNIESLSTKDRSIGIVPQEGALFPHMNVFKNISFGIKTNKVERVRECLKLVGLDKIENILEKKPSQLSGGQQQRVSIARALAPNPKIIIFDEAFSALDQALRIKIRRDIIKTLKSLNTTIIIITHDSNEAFELADEIFVLDSGTIVQKGKAEEIYFNPISKKVANLVGISNYIKIEGKQKIIRPEQIKITKQNTDSYAGQITDICNLGGQKQIFIKVDEELSDHEIIALIDPNELADIGEKVYFEFLKT